VVVGEAEADAPADDAEADAPAAGAEADEPEVEDAADGAELEDPELEDEELEDAELEDPEQAVTRARDRAPATAAAADLLCNFIVGSSDWRASGQRA
jgi:hypothetical protein